MGKSHEEGPPTRISHVIDSIMFGTIGLLLAVSWFVAISSLATPWPWADAHPEIFSLGVVIAGTGVLAVPSMRFIAAGFIFRPERRKHLLSGEPTKR